MGEVLCETRRDYVEVCEANLWVSVSDYRVLLCIRDMHGVVRRSVRVVVPAQAAVSGAGIDLPISLSFPAMLPTEEN